RDGFDPVNDVLQLKVRARSLGDVEGGPRIGRLRADVQEERAVRTQHARGCGDPLVRPREVVGLAQRVLVPVVPDAEVVGRRRDGREPIAHDRVVAPVGVAAAGLALLLDVGYFAARGHLAVLAHDAAAGEGGEAEKTNEAHRAYLRTCHSTQQIPYRTPKA